MQWFGIVLFKIFHGSFMFWFYTVCMGHIVEYTYSVAVQARSVVCEAVLCLFWNK